jgi:uncharacterized membrane protein YphA (DoxX/SURF4 family)
MMSDKNKEHIVLVLQILLGVLFIFSGFVKAVDPLGGLYKINDYLTAFHWDWLKALGFIGTILLSAAEFTMGVCMLLGVRIKWTTICVLIFMACMTPLTLYLALYNPVTDCGCFGDALVITNWETFGKNIVISALAILVYVWRGYSHRGYSAKAEIGIAAYTMIAVSGLSFYCMRNLPLIDFRPYTIGTNVPMAMQLPANAKRDSIKTTLIYEKNGVQKEFTIDNYPQDSTWKFVDSKNEVIVKGDVPKIHDFTLEDPDQGEITDDVLNDSNYVFLLVAHNLSEYNLLTNPAGAHTEYADKVNDAYEYAKSNGYKFYCMTASGTESDEMANYIKKTKATYPFVNSDEIMLKTIIRSSPGLMLIKKGIIMGKWSVQNLPTFSEPLDKCELGQQQPTHPLRNTIIFFILFCLPLAAAFAVSKKRAETK